MKATICTCCGQAIRARKPVARVAVNTTEMTDAQLFAHYKKTAHVEDIRFALRVNTSMSPDARADYQCLLADALNGLSRTDTYRRYIDIQDRVRRAYWDAQPKAEAEPEQPEYVEEPELVAVA